MSQRAPDPTQMSRGEKLVTGLTMAMLLAGFVAGGFGALADGSPPPRQVHFREASAYVPALPLEGGPQRAGWLTCRVFGCQRAGAAAGAGRRSRILISRR